MDENQEARESLQEALRDSIDSSALEPLVKVLGCVGIQAEITVGAVLSGREGQSDAAAELLRLLDERVDRDSFLEDDELFSDTNQAKADFDAWQRLLFRQIGSLLTYFKTNTKTINDSFALLRRKKRQSRSDDDWMNTLSQFAAEEFIGVDLQSTINMLPQYIAVHALSQRMNDIPGRFAWQTFTILENSDDEDEDETTGASKAFSGTGLEYEHHIASVISDHVPDASVTVTRASGDQGADIIFEIDRFRVVIQTKLYTKPVGNDAVQQVHAAKRHYGATAAMVVTNSSFTKSAEQLAESLGVILVHEDDVGPLFRQAYA